MSTEVPALTLAADSVEDRGRSGWSSFVWEPGGRSGDDDDERTRLLDFLAATSSVDALFRSEPPPDLPNRPPPELFLFGAPSGELFRFVLPPTRSFDELRRFPPFTCPRNFAFRRSKNGRFSGVFSILKILYLSGVAQTRMMKMNDRMTTTPSAAMSPMVPGCDTHSFHD